MKTFNKLLIPLAGGFTASLLSLFILAILPTTNLFTEFSLILESFIEEFVKLCLLWFMVANSNISIKTFPRLKIAIFWGIGFSLFEFLLLLNNPNYTLNYYFILTTLIHIITSILLLTPLYNKNKKLSTKTFTFFILAFFIHLCYNLVVLKFI